MQGPTAATMRNGRAPRSTIAAHRRLDDAAERAAPAGMAAATTRASIGDQHRRAVGRQSAANHVRRSR